MCEAYKAVSLYRILQGSVNFPQLCRHLLAQLCTHLLGTRTALHTLNQSCTTLGALTAALHNLAQPSRSALVQPCKTHTALYSLVQPCIALVQYLYGLVKPCTALYTLARHLQPSIAPGQPSTASKSLAQRCTQPSTHFTTLRTLWHLHSLVLTGRRRIILCYGRFLSFSLIFPLFFLFLTWCLPYYLTGEKNDLCSW